MDELSLENVTRMIRRGEITNPEIINWYNAEILDEYYTEDDNEMPEL